MCLPSGLSVGVPVPWLSWGSKSPSQSLARTWSRCWAHLEAGPSHVQEEDKKLAEIAEKNADYWRQREQDQKFIGANNVSDFLDVILTYIPACFCNFYFCSFSSICSL